MKKLTKRNKIIILGLIALVMVNINTVIDYLDYADHALIREMQARPGEYSWWELISSARRAFNPSEDYAEYRARMKREHRSLSERPSQAYREYLQNRDVTVLKHIPLGTSAEAAMEICRQNGFKTTEPRELNISHRSFYPSMEKSIYCTVTDFSWYLIVTNEYRVIVYLKNNQVGLVTGRRFVSLFGGL